MRFTLTALAAALAASVVVAGTSARTTPTSTVQQPAKVNIVRTAVNAGQFTTLASLLQKAGLARTLQGRGPFTVFAPTDAAFAKVPRSTLNALARDRAKLRAVLLYHVAAGKVPASKVVRLKSVKTLNGANARIRVSGGRVFVGGARVTTPDVMASNGVIHVINKVLIPPAG